MATKWLDMITSHGGLINTVYDQSKCMTSQDDWPKRHLARGGGASLKRLGILMNTNRILSG